MIFESIQLLSRQLNDYLKLRFKLSEDIVFVSPVKDENKSFPNRVSISLVGLERESAAGIQFQRKRISDSSFAESAPSWQINLNLLISVIFQEKLYEESLRLFSGVVSFIQKNNLLRLGAEGRSVSLEVVNLSVNELSNLWSFCGENYYPSLVCKMRLIEVDSEEINDLSYIISKPEETAGIK